MDKQSLRKLIAQEKKNHTAEQLKAWSSSILQQVENHPSFIHAGTVLLYYSLPDEVHTHAFIERWKDRKRLILPVVIGPTELELRCYTGKQDLAKGKFGIEEPIGKAFTAFQEIDLAIIPGVGFDKQGNRLGRGKGYYDRILPEIQAPKIGICYHFQLFDTIPTNQYDQPMNEVITNTI